ncbi:SDR family oxidoreductase [Yinghuangia seranimata]|uniref:SDR family oxidoreductase n=1 Tax=Yinghuangia seranimata TaxID=408067 RepID=UPI00248C5DFB|nr:SDR family oxidoreductase [Yinghuangia seranimata]MDI2131235.1 SDR family oxidoreductase [Yinghuangia seranimata]
MTNTAKNILVTGGTGALGSLLVPRLVEAGQKVRVLTRGTRPADESVEYVACDLLKGEGVDEAVAGVDTIVHLAGGPKGDDVATGHLVAAAKKAGVGHIVYISVIGADTMPIGYFRAKHGAERAIAESGIPYTTLRAAQFHYLALNIVRSMTKMPFLPVPGGLRFQPVDARDVADRMLELTLGEPAGLVPDLTGPTVYDVRELAAGYLAATGKKRVKLPVRIPGKIGKAYRAGENLTLEGALVGTRTFEDYLATELV